MSCSGSFSRTTPGIPVAYLELVFRKHMRESNINSTFGPFYYKNKHNWGKSGTNFLLLVFVSARGDRWHAVVVASGGKETGQPPERQRGFVSPGRHFFFKVFLGIRKRSSVGEAIAGTSSLSPAAEKKSGR